MSFGSGAGTAEAGAVVISVVAAGAGRLPWASSTAPPVLPARAAGSVTDAAARPASRGPAAVEDVQRAFGDERHAERLGDCLDVLRRREHGVFDVQRCVLALQRFLAFDRRARAVRELQAHELKRHQSDNGQRR